MAKTYAVMTLAERKQFVGRLLSPTATLSADKRSKLEAAQAIARILADVPAHMWAGIWDRACDIVSLTTKPIVTEGRDD